MRLAPDTCGLLSWNLAPDRLSAPAADALALITSDERRRAYYPRCLS